MHGMQWHPRIVVSSFFSYSYINPGHWEPDTSDHCIRASDPELSLKDKDRRGLRMTTFAPKATGQLAVDPKFQPWVEK